MKQLSFLILLLALCSCKESGRSRITHLIREWEGKEFFFPENIVFTQYGKDTLDYQLPESGYTIVSYIDSTGCTSCKLQFERWKQVMHEMDSIAGRELSFLFIFHPKNKDAYKELAYLMRRDKFTNPSWIDTQGEFYKKNKFSIEDEFRTFLINSRHEVIVMGSPFINPKVRELYLKVIVDGRETTPHSVMTSAYIKEPVLNLGEFDVNTPQETVFTLCNSGKERLVINDIISSCDCISADYPRNPIDPGKEVSILVRYHADKPGHISKSLFVHANIEKTLQLLVKGSAH